MIYDEAGQLLTGTFMDYPMPRAEDMPPLSIEHLDFPSPINELGIKGVGESGVVSPAAVIGGAVEDALWDRGVRVSRVPLTPARIFQLLPSGKALSPASGERAG
jgi:carbon-monoxide dehydrogenase large subunit